MTAGRRAPIATRALASLVLLSVVGGVVGAGPARADAVGDEARFVTLINQDRAASGAGPLTVLTSLVALARSHSLDMVATGTIWHTADLTSKAPAGWQLLGENVGTGTGISVDVLHQVFMNSPPHRDNILNPAFNALGVGVEYSPTGAMFVTEEFIQGPLDGVTASQIYPIPPSQAPAVAGPTSVPRNDWYFAEGFTGPGFSERLEVLNPLAATANVTITYLLPGGATKAQVLSIAGPRRATVDVNAAVGPGQEVSAVVHSDSPVVAERSLHFLFQGRWDGESVLVGLPAPATSFYFAEGYTGDNFQEYLTLANPQGADAPTTVTYLFADGSTADTPMVLPAHSRTTVDVNKAVGPGRELGVRIVSGQAIMAERPMYFDYNGNWTGGHISSGLNSPGTHFSFAEGYTGSGFLEYLTLLNPGDVPAHVSLTYLLGGGGTVPQAVTVTPRSRFTIRVNDVVPGKEVSVDLTSDAPVVAERPMYFDYKGSVTGGHDVVGSKGPARFWLFPGGDTTNGTDTYLTVGNPQDHQVTFTVTFIDDRGQTLVRNFNVGAQSRQTLTMAAEAGSGRLLGAQLAASDPVVAEEPTYTQSDVNGGADTLGFSF